MTSTHTIRVSLRSEGDGLLDVDFGSWKQRGWTIHPMDRHGVQYEARKTIRLPPQDDGLRVAA
ncbi:hypothetical protein [Amantichitinum ursilacus]|uniref:Uncharacterized protein n=1 Tax=Amantichitinum ursilacus TaxID=857265 RepID=A0A0N0GNN5_9NEIS|nr:hypothetical protein [Amantichitinum ursilacus]KPC53002.1 hypothetical protein WG78_10945 [Amantichitinum ursilacus]